MLLFLGDTLKFGEIKDLEQVHLVTNDRTRVGGQVT